MKIKDLARSDQEENAGRNFYEKRSMLKDYGEEKPSTM